MLQFEPAASVMVESKITSVTFEPGDIGALIVNAPPTSQTSAWELRAALIAAMSVAPVASPDGVRILAAIRLTFPTELATAIVLPVIEIPVPADSSPAPEN